MLNKLVIYPHSPLIDNIRRVIDHRKLQIMTGNVKNKLYRDCWIFREGKEETKT